MAAEPPRYAMARGLIAARSLWIAVLLCIAGLFWIAGCASQGPPVGGPPDKEPPVVVRSSPEPGALRYRETKLVLEFSEDLDRRSFQESVFLSPSPGALRYDWSGSDVEISFAESLKANTTYILTIGTDAKDSRTNRLAEAFNLAFSTGETIDSCSVEGRVHDSAPGGTMVFAYDVGEGRGDTLNPASVRPDYLTQTGEDGRFTIRNMKKGRYRLMALRDVFKNQLYNIQNDSYAMASDDVRLDDSVRTLQGVGFRLALEDTLRPFLSGVRTRDGSSVLLRFNEALAPASESFVGSITDTSHGTPLGVLDVAQADSTGRDYLVTTTPQDSGAVYRLVLGPFTDRQGNRSVSPGMSGLFTAVPDPDTVPPVITLSIPRDSVTGILPDDTVRISFNEPVDTGSFTGGFSLRRADLSAIVGALRWRGPMMAEFLPESAFAPGEWYALSARLDSVRDRAGNVPRDSVISRRFRIREDKLLGSIGGNVVASEGSSPGAGAVFVEAEGPSGAETGHRRVRADASGKFLFDRIPDGLYRLWAFVDGNGNGVHDSGIPYPLRFAEEFGVYADTLKVRPKWPIEGVRIGIGK